MIHVSQGYLGGVLRPLFLSGTLLTASCDNGTVAPDRPLPFPGYGGGMAGGGMDGVGGAGGGANVCQPESCAGFLDESRGGPGQALCLFFEEVHQAVGLVSSGSLHGVSVSDFDQDGKKDVYLLKKNAPNELFRNVGGSFQNATAMTGLGSPGGSRAAAWGDYDQDGDMDVVLVGESGSRLFKNQSGNFMAVPAPKGINDVNPGKTAVWLGSRLFLSTVNGLRLYRHTGTDDFVEESQLAGVDDPGDGSALAVADYDGDGFLDVYLANSTGINRCFRQLPNGHFESIEAENGTVGQGNSSDAAAVLFDGGAHPSIYVANFGSPNQFFINQQDGAFVDKAGELEVADPGNTTRVVWGDFLSEMRPALFLGRWNQQNLLYVPKLDAGQKVTGYADRAYPLGMAQAGETIGAEWLDFDQDGQLDLVVVMAQGGIALFRNKTKIVKVCEEEP